jgi:hypothetical protein
MNLLNKLLSNLPIFDKMNEFKTIYGAVILTVSTALGLAVDFIGFWPDVEALVKVHDTIDYSLGVLIEFGEVFGWTLMSLGVGHKVVKKVDS